MNDELLTTGEAAVLLGSSRQHVVDLCERGYLVCVRVGTHRRLRRADVEALTRSTLTRDQERSLWLHRVVAGRVAMDPDGTVTKARANIETLRRAHPDGAARRWIEQWEMLLDGSIDSLLDILTSPSERAVELRQNSPFAGVLSEQDRQTVLVAFRAHWRRDHDA
ncbi:MAG: excisionase family DNA-binding protein [Pseudonocardiaceae bacterium]